MIKRISIFTVTLISLPIISAISYFTPFDKTLSVLVFVLLLVILYFLTNPFVEIDANHVLFDNSLTDLKALRKLYYSGTYVVFNPKRMKVLPLSLNDEIVIFCKGIYHLKWNVKCERTELAVHNWHIFLLSIETTYLKDLKIVIKELTYGLINTDVATVESIEKYLKEFLAYSGGEITLTLERQN